MTTASAMQVRELGARLTPAQVEFTPPQPNEVTIKVAACSLNFADILMIQGKYQEKFAPPFSPGLEVSGEVVEVGSGVQTLSVGQKVVSYCGVGGLTTLLNVTAERVVHLPDDADLAIQAAVPIAYGTAHLGLWHRADLRPGETLLVLGASGGVGLTAIEIGKQLGATVIAVARGPEKLDVARAAGADFLIDSDKEDLREKTKSLGGADVVFDPVGGAQFDAALRASNPEARILPLGFASGDVPQIPANILLVKNVSVLGFYWGGYLKFAPDVLNQSLQTLVGWAHTQKIRPHISHRFPLSEANEALDLIRTRKSTGKVIIDMAM